MYLHIPQIAERDDDRLRHTDEEEQCVASEEALEHIGLFDRAAAADLRFEHNCAQQRTDPLRKHGVKRCGARAVGGDIVLTHGLALNGRGEVAAYLVAVAVNGFGYLLELVGVFERRQKLCYIRNSEMLLSSVTALWAADLAPPRPFLSESTVFI